LATDNRAELRKLQVLVRSLQQISDDPDMWENMLHRMGEGIVSEAKLRAPVDRGALRRAISYRLKSSGLGIEVGVLGGEHRGVPYGRIIELGGIIKPKKGKFLAIPLEPQYRDRSPRAFDLAFVTLGGKVYMIDRLTGKPAYRLKKTVTIKPQPYLRPAIEEYRDRKFQKLLNSVMDKFMGGI